MPSFGKTGRRSVQTRRWAEGRNANPEGALDQVECWNQLLWLCLDHAETNWDVPCEAAHQLCAHSNNLSVN